jgi:hypothetical protein
MCKSAWHHALVAISHWLVQVGSRSSHLLVHTWKTFDYVVKPGSIFKGKLIRDVSMGKCYHSLLYPEAGFKCFSIINTNLLKNEIPQPWDITNSTVFSFELAAYL